MTSLFPLVIQTRHALFLNVLALSNDFSENTNVCKAHEDKWKSKKQHEEHNVVNKFGSHDVVSWFFIQIVVEWVEPNKLY